VHLQPLYSVGQTLKFIALLVGRICKNAVSSQDLSGHNSEFAHTNVIVNIKPRTKLTITLPSSPLSHLQSITGNLHFVNRDIFTSIRHPQEKHHRVGDR